MANVTNHKNSEFSTLLYKLKAPLDDLNARCSQLDASIEQTENHCFVFEIHLFSKRSLSLTGYFAQINNTYLSLQEAVEKKLPESLIKHESNRLIAQFQVLQKLVQGLEKGKAKLLYRSYSFPKEQIYQQLKKQSEYEHRLLAMISEQEELLVNCEPKARIYIKEKIAALKVRYQKCNAFTQKLEFKLEEIKDE